MQRGDFLVFSIVNSWFDPCPFPKPEWDGLTVNWLSHEKVFCNPPYDTIKAWAKKCYETLIEAKMNNQPVEMELQIVFIYHDSQFGALFDTRLNVNVL